MHFDYFSRQIRLMIMQRDNFITGICETFYGVALFWMRIVISLMACGERLHFKNNVYLVLYNLLNVY